MQFTQHDNLTYDIYSHNVTIPFNYRFVVKLANWPTDMQELDSYFNQIYFEGIPVILVNLQQKLLTSRCCLSGPRQS